MLYYKQCLNIFQNQKQEIKSHNLLKQIPLAQTIPKNIPFHMSVTNPPATDVVMSLINNDHKKCVIPVFVITDDIFVAEVLQKSLYEVICQMSTHWSKKPYLRSTRHPLYTKLCIYSRHSTLGKRLDRGTIPAQCSTIASYSCASLRVNLQISVGPSTWVIVVVSCSSSPLWTPRSPERKYLVLYLSKDEREALHILL